MRSPITAMTWELWRVTRRALMFQVATATLVGAAVLTVASIYGQTGRASTVLLMALGMMCVMSGAWVKGMDQRSGFPLYLSYARPVPTWLLAGVPMAYLAAATALSYLVPALVLRLVFRLPFPLASVAAIVVALALVVAAVQWWAHIKWIQAAGAYLFTGMIFFAYRTHHPISQPGNDFPPESWAEMFTLSFPDRLAIGGLLVASWA